MKFTKENTLELKGIMVLLLVFHHCFYRIDSLGPTFYFGNMSYNLVKSIAVASRICVTAFIILSGYGIYKTVCTDKYKLYTKSFVRLYINYEFIVLITLAITLIFKNDFPEVYGETSIMKVLYRIVTSLSGLEYLFASGGINMVWWFASFLIICYLTYPLLLKSIEKAPCIILLLTLVFVPFRHVEIFHVGVFGILSYISAFVLGIILARYEIMEKMVLFFKRRWLLFLMLLFVILKILLYRTEIVTYYIDLCLTVVLMLLLMQKKRSMRVSEWFGKISMDIYYMHYLFVFYIAVFSNFIYSKQYFTLIFIKAVVISIVSHYVVDFLRKILHINKLILLISIKLESKFKKIQLS